MSWNGLKRFGFGRKKEIPDGLFVKCEECEILIYKKTLEERFKVCPHCNYHFTMSAGERIDLLIDKDTFTEIYADMMPADPLEFKAIATYREKLQEMQLATGLKDAVVLGTGRVNGIDIVIGVTDSRFLMGSMGSVVGEKITRGVELAGDTKRPLVLVSGSGGGARMYEGTLSLLQMAKTSAAIGRFSRAGGLYVSILTNPTMGGVMASFAALGDIIIAEPKALIGFTGPRVIQETIKQELPHGFQRSEFLLKHGFIDRIVSRENLKTELARILEYLT